MATEAKEGLGNEDFNTEDYDDEMIRTLESWEDKEGGTPEAEEQPAAPVDGEAKQEQEEAAAVTGSEQAEDVGEIPIDELKSGYMRQQDYTRKRQEDAKLRKQMELRMAELDALYGELESQGLTRQQKQPEPRADTSDSQYDEMMTPAEKALAKRLESIEHSMQSQEAQRRQEEHRRVFESARHQVDETIKGFKQSHPDVSDDALAEILGEANDLKMAPSLKGLERLYAARMDIDEVKKKHGDEVLKKFQEELKKKGQAGLLPSRGPSESPEPKDVNKLSDEQRHDLMVEELKRNK